ncbi:MAG: deoxyribonuclease IV [Chloroflexi bacterium]|nr:deoxyribonuclease IV [Chloroflexota bacterium]
MSPTLPDDRRLGAHLPLGGGMVGAVERASAIGARSLQVFADNPTAWRRRTEPPRELPAFRRRLDELDIRPVAIHAAYLVNLAGPEEEFRERSIAVLASELRAAVAFGARFVNVHVGSHKLTGLDAGIDRVGEGIARALDAAGGDAADGAAADGAIIVLENSAGGGGGIGVSVGELAAVLESIARRGADMGRVAFCLDTAHLWGAGHDLRRPETIEALLDEFDASVGLDRLAMIHLNDSKTGLGSRTDRHEHLGAGTIGVPGLRHLLTAPRLRRVTYILETPGMDEGYDAVNIARAYAIAAGEPLEPLPPEAFALRGSRARTAPREEPA